MNIKQNLFNLYSSKWDDFAHQLKKSNYLDNFAMPFLLDVPDSLEDKFKIMIYGQETWGWHDGASLDGWVEKGMHGYKRFFWDKNFYNGYQRSSFWQTFRFYEKHIPKILNENKIIQEPIFIWNNISKLGLGNGKTGVNETSRAVEQKYFNVVKEEFEIIQPDLVIFLTGPTRDHDIKFNFKDAEFKQAIDTFSQRKMALVDINGISGLRLYHPAYFGGFNKKYKKDTLEVLKSMINHKLIISCE